MLDKSTHFFCLFLFSNEAGSKSARLRERPFEVAVTKPLLLADCRTICPLGKTVLVVIYNIRQIDLSGRILTQWFTE